MIQSARSADKTTSASLRSQRPWFLIFIFRVLLLGVSGGLALIVGIVLATFYPRTNPEKPFFLKMATPFEGRTPVVSPHTTPTSIPEPTGSPLQLTPVQRQQVQAQLTQLQGQLRALSEGVATLEAQLGNSRPNESLEARLQAIALQLQGIQPPPEETISNGNNPNATIMAAPSDSFGSTQTLKVTLPSDVLFEGNNSLLRPEAGLILDKIIADLRNYPSSTIRIAAHTDSLGKPENNRELSFRRAKAVEQYFARALGDDYRWLVVGYGEIRPLVSNDTDANQQRNRRIEIAVE
ncbi:MAG: OmpA family protein [Coleofasciculus sp. G3-WIS-01]|uniref:OmpA family protein n=1 Tax=Coleofasciculus sp. G3-WIS-01 TaxID=3069528 RepID=UPI0032F73953